MTISRIPLSGSTSGKNIKIVATSTLGTTIHAAHATAHDEIWLWGFNSDTTDRLLSLEFGGVATPDDVMPIIMIAKGNATTDGPQLLIPGLILTGSLSLTGFCAAANVVMVQGYVNRIV